MKFFFCLTRQNKFKPINSKKQVFFIFIVKILTKNFKIYNFYAKIG